jgi:hypothetical protein
MTGSMKPACLLLIAALAAASCRETGEDRQPVRPPNGPVRG